MFKKIAVFFILSLILIIGYLKFGPNNKTKNIVSTNEETYKTNILENIKYVAKDIDGNEYIINASKGEIDLDNSEVIFLENVKSKVKLNNSEEINITSNFGKYNVSNYDTIFSKNVIITYLDNKIVGEYLDFSLIQNRMIISRNVVFTNIENILKADVVELDIKSKDTKIFMYEKEKNINIKNKNYSKGSN